MFMRLRRACAAAWPSACLLVFGAASTPMAQQANALPAAPDVQTLGPQVGSPAPDFSLHDQHGQIQTLKSLTGPKGVTLVFFRSADW